MNFHFCLEILQSLHSPTPAKGRACPKACDQDFFVVANIEQV